MLAKRKSGSLIALIILCVTGSLLTAPSASAATSYVEGTDLAAPMFDPLKINNFSLQMSEPDFESLQYPNVSWDNEGDWRATRMSFTMAGKIYGPYKVGLHLKGAWGSWRDVTGKAGFKIKMDAFVKGQTLLGLNVLNLNNMVQDQSYSHEAITYRLFRKLGIPAPRTGYAGVSLNGINYGLHLNVETMNKQLLDRWGITSKHLYKGAVPNFPDFYPDTEWTFAVESGSQSDFTDMNNFMAIQNLDGEQWFSEMSKLTNMKLLTLGWASEIYSSHWDGYAINRNNFFVNFDKSGKVSLLPWGADQTWGGALDYASSPALLTNKCWAYQPCLETYRQSMAKVARIAGTIDLRTMARSIASNIYSAISKDPFGPGIETATNAQSSLQNQLIDQLNTLRSIVEPWDTTLSEVKVNGVAYAPDQAIYMPAGTKKVKLSTTTSQAQATAITPPIVELVPGMNTVSVQVTSENGEHKNPTVIEIYVYTNKVVRTTISFNTNSEVLTFEGLSATGLLGTELGTAKKIRLLIDMPAPKNMPLTKVRVLLNKRTNQFLAALSKQGVRPIQVTPTFSKSKTLDYLKIYATYLK